MKSTENQIERAARAIGAMTGSDLPVYWADHPTMPGFELRATSRGILVRKAKTPEQLAMFRTLKSTDYQE